ncbi:hypothetical protein K8I31_18865 [bacterium]|nr:hypothetical protein [bacterium]
MKNESVKDIIEKAKQEHILYGVTPPGPWPPPPKDWMVKKTDDESAKKSSPTNGRGANSANQP